MADPLAPAIKYLSVNAGISFGEGDASEWKDLASTIYRSALADPPLQKKFRTALPALSLDIASLLLGISKVELGHFKGASTLASTVYDKARADVFELVLKTSELAEYIIDAAPLAFNCDSLKPWALQMVRKYEKAKEIDKDEQPLAHIAAFALLLESKKNPFPVKPRTLSQIVSRMKPFLAEVEKSKDFVKTKRAASNTKSEPVPSKRACEYESFSIELDQRPNVSVPSTKKSKELKVIEEEVPVFRRATILPMLSFCQTKKFATVYQRMKDAGLCN